MHDPGHGNTRRRVWRALIVVLAANYLALGITSVGQTRVLAIGGGALIVAAFIAATASTPRLIVALAVLGATPLAITTWWSIVTPLLATVTIAITLAARPHTGHRLLPDRGNPANNRIDQADHLVELESQRGGVDPTCKEVTYPELPLRVATGRARQPSTVASIRR